jgi:hypothetical protein
LDDYEYDEIIETRKAKWNRWRRWYQPGGTVIA